MAKILQISFSEDLPAKVRFVDSIAPASKEERTLHLRGASKEDPNIEALHVLNCISGGQCVQVIERVANAVRCVFDPIMNPIPAPEKPVFIRVLFYRAEPQSHVVFTKLHWSLQEAWGMEQDSQREDFKVVHVPFDRAGSEVQFLKRLEALDQATEGRLHSDLKRLLEEISHAVRAEFERVH